MNRSLGQLRQRLCAERQARQRKLSEMQTERTRIKDWLSSLVGQRFACYVCQEALPLSMLVFNDRCRHQVCRCCLSKVMFAIDATHPYVCMLCHQNNPDEVAVAPPSVLATLSPGVATVAEYEPTHISYRIQLVDN